MATKKIRVYELARELGVENHVVLELAEQLKIGVKSHSSSIDDPSADRVRRRADELGLRAVERPVHVHDIHASVLYALGLDHKRVTFQRNGRAERPTLTAGNVISEIFA